jgi:hypothetical protein
MRAFATAAWALPVLERYTNSPLSRFPAGVHIPLGHRLPPPHVFEHLLAIVDDRKMFSMARSIVGSMSLTGDACRNCSSSRITAYLLNPKPSHHKATLQFRQIKIGFLFSSARARSAG